MIIPFLNAEKFIQEAIESVFIQTYNNWELLLVDNGSTDHSAEIVRWYAEQYPEKVRYLEHDGHQNRGKSASRSLGIHHAKGEYIALLDADDVWFPHKLEQQVAILGSQPEAAMLYGRSQRWYSWTGKAEDIQRDSIRELGVEPNTLIKPPTLLILFLQNEHIYPCTCSVLVRREVFENIGGFEDSFQDTYDDMVFHAKVFLKAPVFAASECWDKYRIHSHNTWNIAKKTRQYHPVNPNSARWAFLNWLEKYLSKQGTKDTEVWKILQRELWPYRHPILDLFSARRHRYLLKQMKGVLRRTLRIFVRRWLLAKRSSEAR
jgi:glycosyltransferase involved in cell wall biosynthesis